VLKKRRPEIPPQEEEEEKTGKRVFIALLIFILLGAIFGNRPEPLSADQRWRVSHGN
jgi:hypothetical protein